MNPGQAVAAAGKNSNGSGRRALRRTGPVKNVQGARVGEKFDPLSASASTFGGTAPLVSTCLMRSRWPGVAGCQEIVVCTPSGPDGKINSGFSSLRAPRVLTEVYRLGGAQAIAAMAYTAAAAIRPRPERFSAGQRLCGGGQTAVVRHVAVDLLPRPGAVAGAGRMTPPRRVSSLRFAGASRARFG